MAGAESTRERLWSELRGNRRLQWGLAGIAVILFTNLGLDWSDALDAKNRQLRETRSELRTIRAQTKNAAHWERVAAELVRVQGATDKRIWFVSSDAAAQARLNDWLSEVLRSAGARQTNVTLAIVRPYGAKAAAAGAPAGAAAAPPASPPASAEASLRNPHALRELRATASFAFAPAALEGVLAAIEGGGQFANIESLVVNRPGRRVELTVKVLAQQVPTAAWEGPGAHAKPAIPATPAARQPAARS